MARYNHFAECPYNKISFKDLNIGDKFRQRLWKGNVGRYIVCIKINEKEYQEKGSKKIHSPAMPEVVKLSKPFNKVSGSNSSPTLSFKGDYIDIEVTNFPRYPCFNQDYWAAKNCLNGYGYTNYLNFGYPIWLMYRKIEIHPKY